MKCSSTSWHHVVVITTVFGLMTGSVSCWTPALTSTTRFSSRLFAATTTTSDKDTAEYATKQKKILVLGGDGFCGWPTSLHLSDQGHDVVIVDNLSRRKIDIELGCDSLTPIQSPEIRCQAWKEVSGKEIRFVDMDVAKEYDLMVQLIQQEQPDAIVHFAEQRAAPYSMKNSKTKRYTVENNVAGSNNLCCAVIDANVDAHLVHLGTMGVYGYGTSEEKSQKHTLTSFCPEADPPTFCTLHTPEVSITPPSASMPSSGNSIKRTINFESLISIKGSFGEPIWHKRSSMND
jgi:hypothetical protein